MLTNQPPSRKAASITFERGINAKAHRKENAFMQEYLGLAIVDGQIVTAVNCRIYGTNSRNYCCLWYNNKESWGSGSDYAGGYGYHRPSAAAGAFEKAGVTLDTDISGRGHSALEDVVLALTKALYPDAHCQVIVSHP